MAKLSALQRSTAELRSLGFHVAIVERWNPHAHIRQDLFGIFDLLAVSMDGIIGIQVKGDSDGAAAGCRKIEEAAVSFSWLLAGGKIQVWVWRKVAVAPQPGVRRTKAAKQRFELRRVSAALVEGRIVWHELESS